MLQSPIINVLTMSRGGSHVACQWIGSLLGKAQYCTNGSASVTEFIQGGQYIRRGDTPTGVIQDPLPILYLREDAVINDLRRQIPVPAANYVVVLRDPFNLFASRIKSGINGKGASESAGVWVGLAMEVLGMTMYLPNMIVFDYNRWCADLSYRAELAKEFGVNNYDPYIEVPVAKHCGGSSFDGTSISPENLRINALQRWPDYVGNAVWERMLTEQPILLDLAERLYPELTRSVYDAGVKRRNRSRGGPA